MRVLTYVEALAEVDFGKEGTVEIPDDAMVTDAVIIFRYQTPESRAPGTAWSSSYIDNFHRDGVVSAVLDRMRARSLAGWNGEPE